MKKKKNSDNKENDLNFLSDSVIDVEDAFGIHTKFAEALEEKIIQANVENDSLTIGLFGEWGTGKSVIVEKLYEKMNSNDEIAFVKIDVWKYNGLPLLRQVLFEISSQAPTMKLGVKERKKIKEEIERDVMVGIKLGEYETKVTKFLKIWYTPIMIVLAILAGISTILTIFPQIYPQQYAILVSLLEKWSIPAFVLSLGGIIIKTGMFNVIENCFKSISDNLLVMDKTIIPTISPEQFEKLFNDLLEKLNEKGIKKFVIVFDNIDRCKGDFAYEVLSNIKAYMCRNNCIYIIPCDDVAIKHYLNAEYNDNSCKIVGRDFANEFLDKLFNTYFRVPLIDIMARDRFIEKCIAVSTLSNIPKIEKIKEILYYAYKGETPRQIKKYINDFISYYEIALKVDPKKEFLLDDIETFVVMMSIKQIAPCFERELIEDHELIENIKDIIEVSTENLKVKDFLNNIQFKFPKEKSVKSYVYLSESSDEAEQIETMRGGDVFALTNTSAITASKVLKKDKSTSYIIINDITSCILSIINHGINKFISEFDYPGIGRPYSELNKDLKNILLSPIENNDYIYSYLSKISVKNDFERIVQESFRFFNMLDLSESYKEGLLEKFENIPEREKIYETSIMDEGINFSLAIKKYIKTYCENFSVEVNFKENYLELFKVLANNGKYDLFVDDFNQFIAPYILYDHPDWVDMEVMIAMFPTSFKECTSKISLLANDCATIVGRYGHSISSNTSNLFEKLEHLTKFSKLPRNILKKVNNDQYSSSLETDFATYLIKLLNYKDISLDIFVLATKILGERFVDNYFKQGVIAFDEKELLIRKYSQDKDFLELLLESEVSAHVILNDRVLLDIILSYIDKKWKIDNYEIFYNTSRSLSVLESFMNSLDLDLSEKKSLYKEIEKKLIILLDEYAVSDDLTNEPVIKLIGFTLRLTNFDSESFYHNGKEVFKKIVTQKFDAVMNLYEEFKGNAFKNSWLFKEIVNYLFNDFEIKTKEIKDVSKIVAELNDLQAEFDEKFLADIAEKFVVVANTETVIRVGITCLKILAKKKYDFSKYNVQLQMIKDKGICVTEVDELVEVSKGK